MKQKDIALIILVAGVSVVVAVVVSNFLFSSTGGRSKTAEIVDPITAHFATPDTVYFNQNSVDPTQIIHIGDSTNNSPFKQTQ